MKKIFYAFYGLVVILSITTIILVAVTLGIIINRLGSNNDRSLSFVRGIKSDDLMKHLKQLQIIADQSNGTRAIGTQGFNSTLDYITRQLKENTNFLLHYEYFRIPNNVVQGIPELQSEINGLIEHYNYLTDFTHVLFSPSGYLPSPIRLVSIPNLGCQDTDWSSVLVGDSIALVKRGECTFPEKSLLAEKYRAKGLLIYNDGAASDR
ncbi:unnamed protein product, partial [Adineta ricciae]